MGLFPVNGARPPMEVVLDDESVGDHLDGDALVMPQLDGSVIVDMSPAADPVDVASLPFDVNLAEHMPAEELNLLAADILEGIEADIQSRGEWEQMFAQGVKLLGLKIEDASSEVGPTGSVSKVFNQLLMEAVVYYQSNSLGEMLPASGPVKVRDDKVMGEVGRSILADALEKDFNHYLTCIAKEYYPDFDRMLFLQGFSGCVFRKVYRCPIRKRPVSEYITGMDFIVSNNAVSLWDCDRKTHKIMMRQATLRRMQLMGHYRDVDLVVPTESPSESESQIKEVEGTDASPDRPEDQRHTIYESYVELELKGIAEPGAPERLPLPYRVTIDRDSRTILEIRRNWKEGDQEYRERRRFVKYGLVPGLGFYDYGFIHLVGNTTRALTTIERELLDAGQFANFPGFLLAKLAGRQRTTQVRVPPGGGQEIDTGGMPIQDVAMPLPYKEPSGVLASFAEKIADDARRLAMTTEIQVGDGRQDMPVGTTLALLDQATKVMAAVHKRNHVSQQEEFEIFKDLFSEDPQALWRSATSPMRRWMVAQEFSDLLLVPASDPNVPSHMHRIVKASILAERAASKPQLYDDRKVEAYLMGVMGIENPEQQLFQPPQQPDPRAAELGYRFVAAEAAKSEAQARESLADASRSEADAAYKRAEPMFEATRLRQKDDEIFVKAFSEGAKVNAGIAAEGIPRAYPPQRSAGGFSRGGGVENGPSGTEMLLPLIQAIQTTMEQQRKTEDRMDGMMQHIAAASGPRRRRMEGDPRGPNGRIDWSKVSYIDEPYAAEPDIEVINEQ